MSIPFACLLVAVLIPYALAALGARYKLQQFGSIDTHNPRLQQVALQGTGARVQAAQDNAREILPVFASGVFVANLSNADPPTAAALSVTFVVSRVLHAVFYIADIAPARSLVFIVGLVCCIALFFV